MTPGSTPGLGWASCQPARRAEFGVSPEVGERPDRTVRRGVTQSAGLTDGARSRIPRVGHGEFRRREDRLTGRLGDLGSSPGETRVLALVVVDDAADAVVGVIAARPHESRLIRLDPQAEVDDGVDTGVRGDEAHPYQGTIHSFDNRIDTASGTIRARARFDNADLTGSSLDYLGRLQAPTFLYFSQGFGKWIYRNQDRNQKVTGLSLLTELHLNRSLQTADSLASGGIRLGDGATAIEPTADGYVGFTTNSRQQVSDFMILIERPDLCEDEQLAQAYGRLARHAEWAEEGVARSRSQFLYFLYWHESQRAAGRAEGHTASLTHVWPLFSLWEDGRGQRQ